MLNLRFCFAKNTQKPILNIFCSVRKLICRKKIVTFLRDYCYFGKPFSIFSKTPYFGLKRAEKIATRRGNFCDKTVLNFAIKFNFSKFLLKRFRPK